MAQRRSVSFSSGVSARALLTVVGVCQVLGAACSAPPGAVLDSDVDTPMFSGPNGSSGTQNGPLPPANGTGGSAPSLPNGPNPPGVGDGTGGTGSSTPVGGGGSAQVPVGGGGSAQVPVGGSGGALASGGAAGSGTVAPPPAPGEAFFFDDFEAGAVGQAPPGWDFFVAWVANQNNPSGNASALIDGTRAFTGTQSVRFTGGQNPGQITLPLPPGANRLYVRAMVFMTRQLGQNPGANHETLIGIRGTPGQASDEIRFGEIKGVIGTNEVPTDNISPKQDQWGQGPAVTANEWHCLEVQFLGDQAQHELYAYADGELVHSVTAPDQWNNGNLRSNWMEGKFTEVILGWHSFSGIQTDVWMDDVVLSTSPIGCD